MCVSVHDHMCACVCVCVSMCASMCVYVYETGSQHVQVGLELTLCVTQVGFELTILLPQLPKDWLFRF